MGKDVSKESCNVNADKNSERPWNIIVYLTLAFVSLVGVFELFTYFSSFPGAENSHEAWGTTGDFFGGTLNPLLQFVVIAMLFLSIHIQKNELRETRQELIESRKANELAACSLQTQAEFQRTQLELNTIEILLEKHFLEMTEHISTNMFHIDGNTSRVSSIEFCLKQMNINGTHYITSVSVYDGLQGTAIESLEVIHPLLLEQLELLERYAYEKGSIYFIDFWLGRLYHYIHFFKKLQGQGTYTSVGKFEEIKSDIGNYMINRSLSFELIAAKYHVD